KKLQVVAQARVEREPRSRFPFILHVEADVGVRLSSFGDAEVLREAQVGIRSSEEVCQRGERVTAQVGAREGDVRIVQQEVGADANSMRSNLVRKVVDDFVELVLA